MELAFVIKLLAVVFWGVVVGLLAKRMNRNPWGWGVAGALSWFIALVVLAFLPYKCPKCEKSITNKQGKDKFCPSCGSFAAVYPDRKEEQIPRHTPNFLEQPNAEKNELYWSKALTEFESESRRPGLWARLFAEADGNEAVAKAAYLKTRVAELEHEPPAFISALRTKGYKVEFAGSRWLLVSPGGGSTSYFSSLDDLERESVFRLKT